jgi:hypothetical protein
MLAPEIRGTLANLVKRERELADQFRGLDSYDCREPGRCAVVVVVSRPNPVRFDGSDIPSSAGIERRSQLFLTDGVRASIGTIVTEPQHIQGPIVLGHRCETRCVSLSLVAVAGVEHSTVQHCLKRALQTLQLKRVSRSELNLDPRSAAFSRAIASVVSATSTPRTDVPLCN